ncbi:MAG: tyrosinase family protein [Acidobacteriota bacterium]
MKKNHQWSRREFLATSGLAAAAASLPSSSLQAQTPYIRYSMTSSEGLRMLEGYKTAIRRLLAKDPSDPLNWYRLTLIHTLDCPHGNWWFLPWHRGYIGFVEQILRAYSDMPDFALPYWDWTADPEVPASFFGSGNPLDPTCSFFIPTLTEFQSRFGQAIDDFYAGLNGFQRASLWYRGLETPAKLWQDISHDFFPQANARCLTPAQPAFASPPSTCTQGCLGTAQAVSIATINAALAPTDFVTFGSGIADQHSHASHGPFSGPINYGVLEGQPHNKVHNCTGGFMVGYMSPVDPLFYMHHSNVERLWVAWTAKQRAQGFPTLPTGNFGTRWSQELFLFYVNTAGQTLSRSAGDFATVAGTPFNYVYTPGSGGALATAGRWQRRTFDDLSEIPLDLLQDAAKDDGPELLARVTVDPQGRQQGKSFHVLLNPPAGTDASDPSGLHYVATVAFFGRGHGHSRKATFLVPVSPTLRRLKAAGRLEAIAERPQLFLAVQDHLEDTLGAAQQIRAVVSSH